MQLALSSWQDIEAYLETSKGIVIPIGSDPTQATIENGETLIQLAADAVAADFKRFLEG